MYYYLTDQHAAHASDSTLPTDTVYTQDFVSYQHIQQPCVFDARATTHSSAHNEAEEDYTS